MVKLSYIKQNTTPKITETTNKKISNGADNCVLFRVRVGVSCLNQDMYVPLLLRFRFVHRGILSDGRVVTLLQKSVWQKHHCSASSLSPCFIQHPSIGSYEYEWSPRNTNHFLNQIFFQILFTDKITYFAKCRGPCTFTIAFTIFVTFLFIKCTSAIIAFPTF